jgi:putative two-component system response regulator
MEAEFQNARILVIDDEEANIRFLERILGPAGYTNLEFTTDSRQALMLYRAFRPDLVLLDLRMPHFDGLEVMEQFREGDPGGAHVPVLVLTSDISPEAKQQALSNGAKDFLIKPLSPTEVRLRIRNLLETRLLHLQLQNQNERLEERVRDRTEELEEARVEILERLARAAEFRDDNTGRHTQRVGHLSALLATALDLPPDDVQTLRRAAPLHDVGKIGIPDAVLLKEGRLTGPEFRLMKTHTTMGARILSGSRVPLLQLGEVIALTHHERWDGKGYPHGLRGDEIPLTGQIVAVADVFDSLTHERLYKRKWSFEETLAHLETEAGLQFAPVVCRAFLRLAREGHIPGVSMARAAEPLARAR